MADTVTKVQIEGTGWIMNGERHVPSTNLTDEHYIAIQDWITAGNTPDSEYADEAAEILATRPKKIKTIRGEYDSAKIAPVVVNLISYNGGFDSAIKLDAAKRLAVLAGATDVTFYDVSNAPQLLTIADAEAVIIAVATAYQATLAIKQARLVLATDAQTLADLTSA